MTIVKRGSKFRVISGEGKNLGESPTKAGAAKRLGEVEWFKEHKKCIVDPSLIKGNEGMQQYVPIIFKVDKPKDKEAQKLDFPSTTKQLELRDVKQPEFPSTPFTGEAYSQSFHNPRPSNTVKDGTHVIVQGNSPAPQGAGPFRGEHGPDTQFKGSDYVPKKTRKSIMIAGKRVVIRKGSEGTDNSYLRDYPIDRGSTGREFDANEESQKRKDWINSERMKEKVKQADEARKIHSYNPGKGPFDLSQGPNAFLGRSTESDLEKGVAKVLGTAIKQTVKDSLDKEKRQAEAKKIAALTSTVKKAFGKFFDDKNSMKILSDKEINDKQKADKEIKAPKPITRKLREIKVVDKSKGIMKLILQYSQNQPLAAGFKPLLAYLVKEDIDDEENLKGTKMAKKAMSTSDIAEKIAKFPSKGPSSKSRVRLMERAAEQKTENSADDVGPHPDFGKHGGYKGDTSKLGKGAFKDKWIKQQEDKGKDPLEVPKKRKTNPLSISEYTRRKEGSSGTGDSTEGWPPDNYGQAEEGWPPDNYSKKSSRPNPIKGGIGDKLSYDDVDEKELEEGVKVEQEHVKNSDDDEDKKKVKAADIAMDHLAEDDKYYTKLAEMERSGKEGDKAETKKKKLLKIIDKSFVFRRIK